MTSSPLDERMNEVRDKLTKKIDQSLSRIKSADLNRIYGRLIQVIGTTVESIGPPSSVGDFCWIHSNTGRRIPAEVVGFKENRVILMPFSNMSGIQPGNQVRSTGEPLRIGVDSLLLGRVLDGLGNPIDNKGEFVAEKNINVVNSPPPPLERSPINEPLSTGIRAIDGLITIGKGQRIGIFSGSGIGKSTIMGMIARNASSDVNVIGLIGERGREVPEFIKRDLTEEGLKRSVVVAVTSDKPPLLRIKGALCTTAIAEYFRDMGLNVLLMMDSATRIAMAQREIGLAVGEPPTTKGYTPSVFTLLPQILERSGTSSVGSITGIYTVLVEADDMNDPVADSMRSILDGHIVLSRSLAQKNHYPSIDVLASISRVMDQVTDKSHRESATKFRRTLARYMDSEDLINIGAYSTGTNPEIDYAIEKIDDINNYLQQEVSETTTFADTTEMLKSIFV